MEKREINKMNGLILLISVFSLVCCVGTASAQSDILYNAGTDTIYVWQDANFTDIITAVNDESVVKWNGTKEVFLNANLYLNGTGKTLWINDTDVTTLKINSTSGFSHIVDTSIGNTEIDNVTIKTWNTISNTVETLVYGVNRSFWRMGDGHVNNSTIYNVGNATLISTGDYPITEKGFAINQSTNYGYVTNSNFSGTQLIIYRCDDKLIQRNIISHSHSQNKQYALHVCGRGAELSPLFYGSNISVFDNVITATQNKAIRFENANLSNKFWNNTVFGEAALDLYGSNSFFDSRNNRYSSNGYGNSAMTFYLHASGSNNNLTDDTFECLSGKHQAALGFGGAYTVSNAHFTNITINTVSNYNYGVYISRANNVHFNNITINSSTVPTGIYIDGDTYTVDGVSITNAVMQNLEDGISIVGAANGVTIKNSIINNMSDNGIEISDTSTDINVNNTIVTNCVGYGILSNTPNLSCNYNDAWNNIAGNYDGCDAGTGNISQDPLFYNVANNDFHLNSTVGTWNGTAWEVMGDHSPCIDAGDPADDYSNEPSPNGDRINMGAYGNTIYASKSAESGDVYYVSTTGDNENNGLSIATAWETPSYAAQQAQAGDTIYLKDGTWYDEHVVFANSGTVGNPITMKAYNGTPTLDGVDGTGYGMEIWGKDYINVNGITVKTYMKQIYVRDASHVHISDCIALPDNSTSPDYPSGISLSENTHYCSIKNCTVIGDAYNSIQLTGRCYVSGEWYYGASDHLEVSGCEVYNNGLHGLIDFKGNISDSIISNNILHDVGSDAIFFHSGVPNNTTITGNIIYNAGFGMRPINPKDSYIANNIIYDCGTGIEFDYEDVGLGGAEAPETTILYNNTIQNPTYNGMYLNGVNIIVDYNEVVNPGYPHYRFDKDYTSAILRNTRGNQFNVQSVTDAQVTIEYTDGRTFSVDGDGQNHTTYTITSGTHTITVYGGDDTTPPTITDNSPTGTDVAIETDISVTFNESMNTTSAENSFEISPSASGSFSWSGNEMTFDPTSDLSYEQTYTVAIGTGAEDMAGNNLESEYSWNFTTETADTPPSSITNLVNTTYEETYINWTWDNPSDPDFDYVVVYVDDELKGNTSDEYYNATGLVAGTSHTIGTHTVDENGNINTTWVNHTATTKDTSGPDPTPEISFIPPTGPNGSTISVDHTLVNTSSTNATDGTAFLNWDGSLVGWYRFDNSSDLTDHSGWGNDGTNDGSTYTSSGKFGGGRSFDGNNDCINISDSNSLDMAEEITIDAWINRSSSENDHAIVEKWRYDNGVPINERAYILYVNDENGEIVFLLSGDGTFPEEGTGVIVSQNTVSNNVWTHVVATSDGTTMKIYIDGVLDPNTATAPDGIHPSVADLHIGAWHYGVSEIDSYFNGTIDEVKLFNRALSHDEVNASYNAGLNRLFNNFTGLSNGDHSYKAYLVSSDGTVASTEERTITVDVGGTSSYVPPTPTDLENTTGNFWVNHTWSMGSGNVTDSFNVSIDGTWYNGTTDTYYNHTGLSPHGNSEVIIYARNDSGDGTLSEDYLTDTVYLPNNPITITNTSDWSGYAGQTVYLDFDYSDADGDMATFATNATKGNLNSGTGVFIWNTGSEDIGTYLWEFNISDGYGSIDSYVATITVSDTTPPSSITNLVNTTYEETYINWTWDNPSDPDFDYVVVYVDDELKGNTSDEYYNATGLVAGTSHTIGTHTVDENGNINTTWVNHTATTKDTSGPTTTTYDFTTGAGTDKWAYGYEVNYFSECSDTNPNDEITTSEYNQISSDDDTYFDSKDPGLFDEAAIRYKIDISEDVSGITDITVTWKGYRGGYWSYDIELYIWNFDSGEYELLDAETGTSEFTLTGSKTTDIGNYIDANGNLIFLTFYEDGSERFYTDYVGIEVSYIGKSFMA
ncbi:MAG: LamG-like jellyroll fold domain-containing protein [Halobacteriota archaeon]|nr:LamG-like jellyroll fold domain-containing protein [Halobacteriota archaeon]